MAIHKLWIFSILLLSCATTKTLQSQTQQDSDAFISGEFKFFELDNLGNFFTVTNSNEIVRYDSDGTELFRYANKRHGEITSLDVSNPQKLLAYHGDFQVGILLDNTLSEIKTIYFEEFGFWDLQCISMSNDNQIWVFDQNEKILKKISFNGKTLLESNTIIADPIANNVMKDMREIDQKVYLNASNKGLVIFDNYGQLLQSIPEVTALNYDIINGQIVFLNTKMKMMLYKDIITGTIPLALNEQDTEVKDFAVMEKSMFLLTESGILRENLLLGKR